MTNLDKLAQTLIEPIPDKGTSPYETNATVIRLEDGMAWVQIPGGVEETPATLAVSAKAGDDVRVRVTGGKAYVMGNPTSPPTDDALAKKAQENAIRAATAAETASKQAAVANAAATSAVKDAGTAKTAADSAVADAAEAKEAAESVEGIAIEAQTDAGIAKASAANASEYAARALGNLSTVQSVTETLNWITAHGTMTLTTDTALDPTHVYFVRDVDGDYEVGSYSYSVVTEPDVQYISTYYVLSIDESLNNYVGTHLSLTDEGLYVMLDGTSYKVLIGQSVKILNPSGEVISEYGTSATIGQTSGQHIQIGTDSIVFYSAENANAYVAQDKFYSTNAEVSDAFYIGDYSLRTDADSKFVIGRRR